MKRVFSLFLAAAISLSVLLTLTACGGKGDGSAHEHDFQTVWTYDKEYHWRACADGLCTETIEKSAHQWDDGDVYDDGVIYKCTVCQYQRSTDDLSGDVTEAEWRMLLLPEHFKNVTMTVTQELSEEIDGYVRSVITTKVTDDGIYEVFLHYDEEDTLVKSLKKHAYDKEGKLMFSVATGDGDFEEADGVPDTTYEEYYTAYAKGLPKHLVDLSELYASFTYDAADSCYVSEELSQTVELDGGESHTVYYDTFRVWFTDGRLSRIEASCEEMQVVLTYTDYGSTAAE